MGSWGSRIVAAVAALALGPGLAAASSGPAEATSTTPHRLMSHSEYRKIKKGMSIKKVRSIVDSKGKVLEDANGEVGIEWYSKDGKHYGFVFFKNGKARYKEWARGDRYERMSWW